MLREPHYSEYPATEESLPLSSDFGILRSLWPHIAPYKTKVASALVAVLVAALTFIGLGVGLEYLVDYGFAQQESKWLNMAVIGMFSIVLIMAVASYVRLYMVSWLSERVVADLRTHIFKHLLTMDTTFFESTSIGEIQSRLTTDTTLLQIVIGTSFPIALRNILIISGGVIMLMLTSLQLTGVIALIIPLVVVPIILLGRRVRIFSRNTQDKTGGISTRLDESFSFIRTVRAFCRERYVRHLFQDQVEEAFVASMQRVKARSLMTFSVMVLVFGGVSLVLWLGAQAVFDGSMTAGQLSSFLFYAVAVAGASGSLSEIHGDIQRAAGASDRIFQFLGIRPTMKSPVRPQALPKDIKGHILFDDVHFAYEPRPDHKVLDGVSLEIEPGETVALVGPSGSGKTTLFNLLMRFYDPTKGQIEIAGVDLRKLAFRDMRAHMGLVPQEPALFSSTVLDNIRFGRPEATKEEIIAAAKSAYAHEFIEKLPEGYRTPVGEKGVQLSGGQRQRIAIARAVLKDPKILLLDEATSALDTQSERQVQKALEELMKNRTTLVIAHRLSTVEQADRILVLDRGKIVSRGSHDELMGQPGLYKKLASAQLAG